LQIDQKPSAPLNGYEWRDIEFANEASKAPLRTLVADYLLRHQASRFPRLLSMPGSTWRFENLMHDRCGCFSVAIERNIKVIHRGLGHMPRWHQRVPRAFDFPLRNGCVYGWRTDRTTLLNISLEDYLRIGREDHVTKHFRRQWANQTKLWSMVWIDLMSMLCADVESILLRLSSGCSADAPTIPVAITLMRARESAQTQRNISAIATDRAEYVTRILQANRFRTYEHDDTIEYVSGVGTPMMLMLGRFVRRAAEESPHA
jgi:hypothetical protein